VSSDVGTAHNETRREPEARGAFPLLLPILLLLSVTATVLMASL
jgi:hypothetical protein